jgi:hypothetical protein
LYELLTRDLVEEVRGRHAQAVIEQTTPVDETEVAETPVPLPLVVVLAAIAVLSLGTSFKNPLNGLAPFTRHTSSVLDTKKAISMERIEAIGQAIEKFNTVNNHLPAALTDLAPHYISAALLSDPWGNAYKYLQRPDKYLVIGFSADGKADTDLFLSRAIDATAAPAQTQRPQTGGIEILPE